MRIRMTLTKVECLEILTDAIETQAIEYWACDYGPISIRRSDSEFLIQSASFQANNERGEKNTYVITASTIQKGINRVLHPSFQVRSDIRDSIIENDNDDDSCDVIIQAALFGEIVYG